MIPLILSEAATSAPNVALFVAERFGLPVALLGMACWYFMGALKKKNDEYDKMLLLKDQEITRIQEKRLEESKAHSQELIKINREAIDNMSELGQTIEGFASRIK